MLVKFHKIQNQKVAKNKNVQQIGVRIGRDKLEIKDIRKAIKRLNGIWLPKNKHLGQDTR